MQPCAHLWPARLKARPEDFQVVEELALAPAGQGPFRLYRLTKCGWGTEELVRHLARRWRLPRTAFAYGGRKDRTAMAVQHLTIRGRRDRSCAGEGFELRSLGFLPRPMGPDAIAANHFVLLVRGLPGEARPAVADNLRRLTQHGVPNYFDDQRFRSVPQYRGFPAALLLRGQWEEALRQLLTRPGPAAGRGEKERLAALERCWGRWEACLAHARAPVERQVLRHLATPGAPPAHALRLLPRETLSLLLAAYQSHLWNRALAAAVRQRAPAWVALPGLAGEYFFPTLPPGHPAPLGGLAIPTPARRLAPGHPAGATLMEEVLREEGLTPALLALRPLAGAYLSSALRPAAVFPSQLALTWGDPEGDGSHALRLSFSLPPGAYATMVVRALLLRPRKGGGRATSGGTPGAPPPPPQTPPGRWR